jgi:hypothetical protein
MALFFSYISGVAAGCRSESFTEVPGSGTRPVVTFTAGDTFVYDRWDLDQYGYRIGASKRPDIWQVARTGMQIYGASNVTVVIDSLDPQRVDTLLFCFGADGSVAQYGFLAGLVRLMGGRTITPGWDVLLSGEGSPSSGWIVGVADASGTDVVYGSLSPAQDYFSVLVNGKPTIYPAYRVQLSGQTVEYIFWIAGNPPSFPWFREESTGLGNGFEAALSAVTVSGR